MLLSPGLGTYAALANTIAAPVAVQQSGGTAAPLVLPATAGLGHVSFSPTLGQDISLKSSLPAGLSLPAVMSQPARMSAVSPVQALAPVSAVQSRTAAPAMSKTSEAQDRPVPAKVSKMSKSVVEAVESAGPIQTASPETAQALGGKVHSILMGAPLTDSGSDVVVPKAAAAMGSFAAGGLYRSVQTMEAPQPQPEPETPPVKYAPRFWTRVLGAVSIAHGAFPILYGLISPVAGASTVLAVGAALVGTGLLILAPSWFRPVSPKDKTPNEGPFIGFTFVAAGFWNSVALIDLLTTGALHTNTWILGALYSMVGLAFMGMDALKDLAARQPAGKAKSLTPYLVFAGYIGALAAMFLLKDWRNGLGVLVAFGGLMAVILAAYVLPSVIAWVAARLPKNVPSPEVPGGAWEVLAANQKALVWGGGLMGALVSLASWALSGPAVLAAAPVAGVMLGFYLHRLAQRKARP